MTGVQDVQFFDLTSSHQDLNVDVLDTLEIWMTLDHSEKSGAVFQVCVAKGKEELLCI